MLNNLIQIKFGAALAPSVGNSFKSLDDRISTLSGSISNLKVIQKRTNDFRSMSLKLKEANLNLNHHQKNLDSLNKRLKEKRKLTVSDLSRQANLNLKLKKANIAYKDQEDRLSNLSSELKSAGVDTNDLASAQEKLAGKIKASSKEISSMRGVKNDRINKQMKAQQNRSERGAALGGIIGGIASMGAMLINPVLVENEVNRTLLLLKDKLNKKEKKEFVNNLLSTSKDYAFSSRSVFSAASNFAESGYNSKQIKALIKPTLDVATVSRQSPEDVAKLIKASEASFGLDKTKETMAYLSNVILRTHTSSSATVPTLIEAVQTLGGAAKMSGLDTPKTYAMLGGISKITTGSEAGTSIKSFLERLAKTKTRNDIKEQLGFNIIKEDGNMMDVLNIIEKIRNRTEMMTDAKKGNILNSIFESEASKGLLPLMENIDAIMKEANAIKFKGTEKEKTFFEKFKDDKKNKNHKSYTESLKEASEKTTYGSFMKVISAIDNMSIKLFGLVSNEIKLFLDFTSSVINKLTDWTQNNKLLSKSIVSLGIGLTGLTVGASFFKFIASFTGIFRLVGIITKLGTATKIMGGAIAIATSPVTAFIVGASALAAAGYLIYKNWNKITEVLRNLKEKFKNIMSCISDNSYIKNFLGYFSPKNTSFKEKEYSQSLKELKTTSLKNTSIVNNRPQLNLNMNINPSAEQSPTEIAKEVKKEISLWYEEKNQDLISDGLYDPIGAF